MKILTCERVKKNLYLFSCFATPTAALCDGQKAQMRSREIGVQIQVKLLSCISSLEPLGFSPKLSLSARERRESTPYVIQSRAFDKTSQKRKTFREQCRKYIQQSKNTQNRVQSDLTKNSIFPETATNAALSEI